MEMAVTMKSNPTIFMHSDQDPDNDNTRWGSIAHDNVSMVIDSGSDNIKAKDIIIYANRCLWLIAEDILQVRLFMSSTIIK